jgi:hypothetical protein
MLEASEQVGDGAASSALEFFSFWGISTRPHGRVAGCAVHGRVRIMFRCRSKLPTSIGPLLGDENSVKVRDNFRSGAAALERGRGLSASTSLGAATGPAGT